MTNEPFDTTRVPVRPLLWLVLALSATGNLVTSSSDVDVLFRLGFGLPALLSGGALILHHYRHR